LRFLDLKMATESSRIRIRIRIFIPTNQTINNYNIYDERRKKNNHRLVGLVGRPFIPGGVFMKGLEAQ